MQTLVGQPFQNGTCSSWSEQLAGEGEAGLKGVGPAACVSPCHDYIVLQSLVDICRAPAGALQISLREFLQPVAAAVQVTIVAGGSLSPQGFLQPVAAAVQVAYDAGGSLFPRGFL